MRVIHRIRVEGATETADRLRVFLHKAGFLLVPDSSAAVTIELHDGDHLTLDSVDSPLEARIEAHLEDLDGRFGCGAYTKRRAGGNRDPERAVVTVPAGLAEGVALAILRAIVQVSDQAVQRPDPRVVAAPTRPWWRFWTVLGMLLLPGLVAAQPTPAFVHLDADTGAAVSPRVFVGLFTAASGGAAAVALPTTLDNGGFRVTAQGSVTVTDGSGALNVICDSGCAGGTTDTDDASIATGQSTGLQLGLTQVFDGAVWRRLTIGTAGSASTQVLTVQGIASATPVIVGDGSGALNVICDSGCTPGGSFADNSAFTFGTTAINVSGYVFDDTAPNAVTENNAAAPRMSANRVPYGTIRDAAGNERGANVTAGNALVVDGSAVTQPVSATNLDVQIGGSDSLTIGTFPDNEPFNVAQINGVAPLMGNGVTGTGSQRVTIASDNTAFTVNIGTFPDNEPVNAAQWGGTAVLAGAGNTGTGSPRVTLATDNAAIATWGHDVAGTALPSGATVIAGTDGTNTTVPYIDPCQREARTQYVVDIVMAATTEIANAVASEFFYICSMDIFAAGTTNVAFVEDDTDACASPTAGLAGGTTAAEGYNLTAQTGLVKGVGGWWVMKTTTANRYLCIITSAAVQLSGTITYVSAP